MAKRSAKELIESICEGYQDDPASALTRVAAKAGDFGTARMRADGVGIVITYPALIAAKKYLAYVQKQGFGATLVSRGDQFDGEHSVRVMP